MYESVPEIKLLIVTTYAALVTFWWPQMVMVATLMRSGVLIFIGNHRHVKQGLKVIAFSFVGRVFKVHFMRIYICLIEANVRQ